MFHHFITDLGAKKFLHVLFHVSVTDMPEHGTTCKKFWPPNTNTAKRAQHNVRECMRDNTYYAGGCGNISRMRNSVYT